MNSVVQFLYLLLLVNNSLRRIGIDAGIVSIDGGLHLTFLSASCTATMSLLGIFYLPLSLHVQLSSEPNSNAPLSINGYSNAYGYLLNVKDDPHRLETIQSSVTTLCKFLNSYVLNTVKGKLDSECVRLGHPLGTYTIAPVPNITRTPEKRKLGDIIMIDEVVCLLNQEFDRDEYTPEEIEERKRHFAPMYFNHPYNSILNRCFDLPIEDNSAPVNLPNIQWT